MQWDVFCRVIDNFGDIGVCWRLSADLASRGESVRLWTDDASALRWMAPAGAAGVDVLDWPDASACAGLTADGFADVVIEAFGCELPEPFVAAMAARPAPPVWINLEYLSAESYVERSHGLPSPQLSGPGRGLQKWFYYPGFTVRTGGLLQGPRIGSQVGVDAGAWLAARPFAPHPGERCVSLFCYDSETGGEALVKALGEPPCVLLLAGGVSAPRTLPPWVRTQRLPLLSQTDYDILLSACDLNFVRGEDSFVRAQWAGRPFVWQIYPQHDAAHAAKLQAFLEAFLEGAAPAFSAAMRSLWAQWNGLSTGGAPAPDRLEWLRQCDRWLTHLRDLPDLTAGLLEFVSKSR